MSAIWTQTKWRQSDLKGKSVEFSILEDGRILEGKGNFDATEDNEFGMAIWILSTIPKPDGATAETNNISLSQYWVDRIKKNPNSAGAEFLVR